MTNPPEVSPRRQRSERSASSRLPVDADPRREPDGRRIFTEDDLEGYFAAVDPRILARDRRRRHRRQAIVLVVIAVLLAGVTVTAYQVLRGAWSIPGWEAAPPDEELLCPAGEFSYSKSSPVLVYNGTTIGGLAGDVANDLESRRFQIDGVGNKGFTTSNMVAVIMSGPQGRDTAFTIQRNIEGSYYRPDAREDNTVDVILGTKYSGLLPVDRVSTNSGPLDCQRLETEAPTGVQG
ncbi:LytR C-terminal domain-containing protein [Citricoccus sp. GCM10030269]|uniref:LytR C-terminal domain-containing protein n=1 Tax=Citricoccus sp. GCM10030269 TaxID=3273388 RepID=UPI00361C6CE7